MNIHNSTTADQEALVQCLCDSFADDLVVNWFIRQDRHHTIAFREFFSLAVVRMTMPFGHVYHADRFRGVSLWAPPGKWNLGVWDQTLLLPAMLRIAGVRLLPRALVGLHAMEKAHMEEPHMYLSFLCSHPTARGQGIGSALLQSMVDQCDRDRLPIYLENTKQQNEDFYRRFGFERAGHISLGAGSPAYYERMVRQPRPSGSPA